MHIEYILTELLKNSFRATIEAGMEKEPIEVTIAPAPATEAQTAALKVARDPEGQAQALQKHAVGVASNYDQGHVDLQSGANKPDVSASANIRPLDWSTPGMYLF